MFRGGLQESLIVSQGLRHLHLDLLEVLDIPFHDLLRIIGDRTQYHLGGGVVSFSVQFCLGLWVPSLVAAFVA